jgi:hypothetical protein
MLKPPGERVSPPSIPWMSRPRDSAPAGIAAASGSPSAAARPRRPAAINPSAGSTEAPVSGLDHGEQPHEVERWGRRVRRIRR